MKRLNAGSVFFLLLIAVAVVPWGKIGGVVTPTAIEKAVIVEEAKLRPSLPSTQIIALLGAEELGVEVVDQNVVGPDKKTPADLAPFLEAAKTATLPAFVTKRGAKYEAIPAPTTLTALKEALK